MSDADDQMGGSPPPQTGQDKPADAPGDDKKQAEDAEADEASKESFPASDPPANY